jgi:hypothetical protein
MYGGAGGLKEASGPWGDSEPWRPSETSLWCLNWYEQNATAFTRDFGLMPVRLAALGLDGTQLELFVAMQSLIHDNMIFKAQLATEDAARSRSKE